MKDVLKTLSESNNSHWTSFVGAEQPAANEKSLIFDEGAVIDPQKETENTIAAISQLPDCAVLVITKDGNVAALSAAMEVYASVKHFGHQASFLLLKDKEATPEALGEKCKEIVMKWQEELPG